MCNRIRSIQNADKVAERYKIPFRINFEPNPNVAPTDNAPIIRTSSSEGRKAQLARFGMIPSWAKDKKTGVKFTNARYETVKTTPAYREAFKKRRCIIPVEGYYEWREEDGKKQPYLFTRQDNDVMSLAGLWDYVELDNERIYSFTIITGEPNTLSSPVHDRMPCIVDNDNIDAWLDLSANGLDELIVFPSSLMKVHAVNPAMNNPRMKDASVIDDWKR